MSLKTDRVHVHLRPLNTSHIPHIAKHFSSLLVHRYTQVRYAQPIENETDWYHRVRNSDNEIVWGIFPDGVDLPIGVTGIHDVDRIDQSCVSGVIIFERDKWRLGYASATDICRTVQAADVYNRTFIHSVVKVGNNGSVKALINTGYAVSGIDLFANWGFGGWQSDYRLIWIHPERLHSVFPNGLTDYISQAYSHFSVDIQQQYATDYQRSIEQAAKVLDFGRKNIILE